MAHPIELQDLARALLGDLTTDKQRKRLLSFVVVEGKEAIGRLHVVHLSGALQREPVVTGMLCAANVPLIARWQPGLQFMCSHLQLCCRWDYTCVVL